MKLYWLWIGLCSVMLLLGGISVPALAATPGTATDAPALFTANCAGCHVNGGNIVRRGKTLKLKALRRYQVDSVDAIANLITHGKGAMSAYGDRLAPDEIDVLANYVWERAQSNWK